MEFKTYGGLEEIESNANGETRWVDTKKEFILEITSRGEVRVRYQPKTMTTAKIVSAAKIVVTLFVPNPNGYKFVKSADGDKTNLKSLNLVWVPGPRSDAKKHMPARGG